MWSTLPFVLLMLKVLEAQQNSIVLVKHRGTAMKHSAQKFTISIMECAQKCVNSESCVGFDFSAGLCTISYVSLTERRSNTDAYLIERGKKSCNLTQNTAIQDAIHGEYVKSNKECVPETLVMRTSKALTGIRQSIVKNPQPNCQQYCLLNDECLGVEIDVAAVCRTIVPDGTWRVNTKGAVYVKMDSCATLSGTALSALGADARTVIVNRHNMARSQLARGNFTAANNTLPQVTNMRLMKWNFTLELAAQQIAATCKSRGVRIEGENFHINQTTDYLPGQAEKITMWWISERSRNGYVRNLYYGPNLQPLDNGMQVLWADSQDVGCGIQKCASPTSTTFVCKYWPSGKIKDQPMYEEGPTCSACPSGTKCITSGDYIGLCQ